MMQRSVRSCLAIGRLAPLSGIGYNISLIIAKHVFDIGFDIGLESGSKSGFATGIEDFDTRCFISVNV